MKKIGKTPSTEVLSFEEIVIDERMAEKLAVEAFSEGFQIVGFRLADNEPLMYETSYLPKRHFRELTREDIVERPMYDVFLEDYDVTVTSATERCSATTVRQAEEVGLRRG